VPHLLGPATGGIVSKAFLCEVCESKPLWTLTRHGDVVVTWACDEHLSTVAERLQRDFEITQLTVILSSKAHEWADIERALAAIAAESEPSS
jgi:hypothetical protein